MSLSTDATRFVLNGLNLRSDKRGLFLAATDGRSLVAIRVGEPSDVNFNIILPPYIPQSKMDVTLVLDLSKNTAKYMCWLEPTFQLIEGNFPKWEQVVPEDAGNSASVFDPSVIEPVIKAAKIYAGKLGGIEVCANGLGAACVRLIYDPGFLGIVMPLRGEAKHTIKETISNFNQKND